MRKHSIMVQPGFLARASALSKSSKAKLIKILSYLAEDFRHPSLKCKKVKGNKNSVYECRLDKGMRVIYDIAGEVLRCWYVGEHDDALRFATNLSLEDSGILVDDIGPKEFDQNIEILQEYLDHDVSFENFQTLELEYVLQRLNE